MKIISLVKMKKNQKGRVAEVVAGGSLQHKLMTMGIHKDREITKLGHFALRGPVTIRVGRSVLALGHGMASKVMVAIE